MTPCTKIMLDWSQIFLTFSWNVYKPFFLHFPLCFNVFLSDTELRLLNMWSHFRYLKQSLCMRRVTWPLTGGKNSPHFWNSWLQFSYLLCNSQGATTKIKPCYRRKIAFSHYEGYQVYCIAWPVHRRSPKTTRNNFLTPNCLVTIQLLWGYHND